MVFTRKQIGIFRGYVSLQEGTKNAGNRLAGISNCFDVQTLWGCISNCFQDIFIKGQWGVPLTYVDPWYLAGVL